VSTASSGEKKREKPSSPLVAFHRREVSLQKIEKIEEKKARRADA